MICLLCGEDDIKYFIELINYDGSIRYICGLCNGTYTKPVKIPLPEIEPETATTIQEPEPEPEPEQTTTIQEPEPEPEPTTTMKPEPEKKKPVRIIRRKKITTKKKCNKCNDKKKVEIRKTKSIISPLMPNKLNEADRYRLSKLLGYQI